MLFCMKRFVCELPYSGVGVCVRIKTHSTAAVDAVFGCLQLFSGQNISPKPKTRTAGVDSCSSKMLNNFAMKLKGWLVRAQPRFSLFHARAVVLFHPISPLRLYMSPFPAPPRSPLRLPSLGFAAPPTRSATSNPVTPTLTGRRTAKRPSPRSP